MFLPIFLTARWENLLMANYEVNSDLLKKYVPAHTELDEWNGKYYVSLVGFMFLDTKVLGLKIPFHVNFEEVNLRFYVRYKEERFASSWKRGVVFIREIVPKYMIAWVANTLYGEKYLALPMRNAQIKTKEILFVEYAWQFKNQWNTMKIEAMNQPQAMIEGSEEQFISEHYWGYTQQKNEQTSEYQVEHPSWEVYPTLSYEINCNFEALYGKEFGQLAFQTPTSVFLAKGSEISVRQGRKLTNIP